MPQPLVFCGKKTIAPELGSRGKKRARLPGLFSFRRTRLLLLVALAGLAALILVVLLTGLAALALRATLALLLTGLLAWTLLVLVLLLLTFLARLIVLVH